MINKSINNQTGLTESSNDIDTLNSYLETKALKHNYYRTYETKEHFENILKTSCIYLTDGHNWADKDDFDKIQSDKGSKAFVKCFSYAASESVAMWMLYGGINSGGSLVNYKRRLITDIVGNKDNYCFEIQNEEKSWETIDKKYIKKIRLYDVLYYSKNSTGYSVKRSDEFVTIHNDISNVNFIKKYPWNYEMECRLVVYLDKKYLKDKGLSESSVLRIKVDSLKDIISVICSPIEKSTSSKDYKNTTSDLFPLKWEINR